MAVRTSCNPSTHMPPPEAPPTKPLRILCVDDEAAVCSILVWALTRAGYPCEGAADGEEAWHKFSTGRRAFDLVITDHQMPRLDGLALVGRLRQHGAFTGRTIVHATYLDAGTRAAYRALGVDAIVDKPAEIAALIKLIAGWEATSGREERKGIT